MNTTKIKIERPSGNIVILDVTTKFPVGINSTMLEKIRVATANAGRGNVVEAEVVMENSNFAELAQAYNNLHNEGAEGFVPSEDYFKTSKKYKEWTDTTVVI